MGIFFFWGGEGGGVGGDHDCDIGLKNVKIDTKMAELGKKKNLIVSGTPVKHFKTQKSVQKSPKSLKNGENTNLS